MHGEKAIELLAAHIESLPQIDEVEYGQLWFKRFNSIIDLFRLTGYALGVLFFMAAIAIEQLKQIYMKKDQYFSAICMSLGATNGAGIYISLVKWFIGLLLLMLLQTLRRIIDHLFLN